MTKRFSVRLFILLVLLLAAQNGYAQKKGQARIDSLKSELNKYKPACSSPCIADSIKVNLLNAIAWEYKYNIPDSAIVFSNEALKQAKQLQWQKGTAWSYHQLASFYNNKSENYTALKYYLTALSMWEELEKNILPEQRGTILISKSKTVGNLGHVYSALNNYENALDCYFKAIKINEELGNKDGIASGLGNLGNFFMHNKQYSKALSYYLKSMKIDEELQNNNSKKRVGTFLGNTGLAYLYLSDTVKALECFHKSLSINKEVGNKINIARDLGNIAMVYDYQKNYSLALDYYFKSLDMQAEISDKNSMAITLGNIGSSYLDQKKYLEAEKYLKQALQMADTLEVFESVLASNINLSDYYSQVGNYKKALEHYKRGASAKDSLFNAEKTQEITRKEEQHKFDKKESELKVEQDNKDAIAKEELQKQKLLRNSIASGSAIILLSGLFIFFFYKRKRDAEQKQKETLLSLQVSETEMKALRSQMNPHFIFNALQSIQTFLLSNKADDANNYLLKFSKLMRLVLENSQHSEVTLEKDMQALELYMQLESIRLKHPFAYKFHIDESINVDETTIPPLILQPFVENAIWHGLQHKNEPGEINIYISKKGNALQAVVEDNGVGRDMSKKVAQPMLLKKESLGMKLTEERLKLLNETKNVNAQFSITDLFTKENLPAGTKVELSLPLAA